MTKTIEKVDGNWLDRLLNKEPFCLDIEKIKTYGIAFLFKENDKWVFTPRKTDNESLFYNAVFFIRFNWPLGIFIHIRWADKARRAFLQTGLGWKLNGRISAILRIQSDESAAAGVSGPNLGQATGFNFGTH